MIPPATFIQALAGDAPFFTGVPDSLLKNVGTYLAAALPPEHHVIAANEGAAVGLAIGHHLSTGAIPVVYLQNSGIGNTINPLLSLADPEVYGIPMILLVGWRGQPGVPDEPQHVKQGRVMTALLDAMEIPTFVLPRTEAEALEVVERARQRAAASSGPVAILVEKDTFSAADLPAPGMTADPAAARYPSREEAVVAFAEAVGPDAVVVGTTGMLGRELFEYRETRPRSRQLDFLCVGGMGHATSIAQGITLAGSRAEVWAFDGDGALLMHQGSLAVIASTAVPTFFHVVFNNGVHDSVGGQPTAISSVDVPALALASGYRGSSRITDCTEVAAAVARARESGGPYLIEIRVRPGNRDGIGRPTRTPQQSKRAFMDALTEE